MNESVKIKNIGTIRLREVEGNGITGLPAITVF
jgi:hypothetical protein